jgi:hypothetical protein
MNRAAAALAFLLLAGEAAAEDAVVRIEERAFRAGAGRITFSEVPLLTANPVYPPARYGGGAGSPTVSFGGHFRGRRLGAAGECPRGVRITGCLAGSPAAPLALDPRAPAVRTLSNEGVPGSQSPELGGTPTWNGPIAVLFDRDVAAVGLQGGYFDAPQGVAVTVYDRQGQVLGRTVNRGLGFEFMGLASRDGTAKIAGLEFHLVGNEPAGFGIDNLRFGAPEQVEVPNLPPRRPDPPREPERPLLLP